ncbi:MAG: large repetitive protein, partial [Chloroflexota bacterium]|nr:large repetitive protein [Chloroflexota bacterium]
MVLTQGSTLIDGPSSAPPGAIAPIARVAAAEARDTAAAALATPAAVPRTQTVDIDAFDTVAAWSVTLGDATIARSVDAAAGRTGLTITDRAPTQRLEIAPATSPAEIGGVPRFLEMDVRGDSAYRPLYIQVRDATGEIFHFRVGRVASPTWQTIRVDLASTPVSTIWGDRDRVLDLPISFFRIVLDPQPGAATATSTVTFDRLRIGVEPWTAPTLQPRTFAPTTGGTGVIRMTSGHDGPYVLTVRDEMKRIRTFRGTATSGRAATAVWNGRDDAGVVMQGSIQARVAYAATAATNRSTVEIPYLGGLLAEKAVDPRSIVGLNTFLSEPDPARRSFVEWQARRLEDARVSQIRETFVWNRLEPRKGWFEWAKFDQAVEISAAHGIGILGVLAFSADWASSAPSTVTGSRRSLYPPTDLADFAAYVRAVVHRYRDRIDEWEVWNEPNHPKFWYPSPNVVRYAAMLHVAAAVIRSEDPGSTIVLGGIVGTDISYLDRLRAAGGWPDFDVLAIHGYVRLSPEASGLGGWFDRAMTYVEKYGVKPVWLTEICWPVSPAEPGIPAVSAATQAAFLGRTYARAAEAGVARVFWYDLIDHPSELGSRYDACGVFAPSGVARPAYAALRTVGTAFDGAVTVGSFDPSASARRALPAPTTRWTAGYLGTVVATATTVSATYRLSTRSDSIPFSTRIPLPGRPTSLVARITGDGTGNSLLVALTDTTGERCSATLGPLRAGSRLVRLPLDGTAANWACSGGDADGILDAPVTLRTITVYPTGIGPLSGTFQLSNMSIGEGPVDRGLVLARGRNLVLLVSRSAAGASGITSIALPGSRATELVNSTRRALTASASVLRMAVGPQLRAIEVPVRMTSAAIAPGTWTWLRWLAADGTLGVAQVIRADGSWVRNDARRTWAAGIQTIAWDGRVVNGAGIRTRVPAGTYTVRVVVTAPDGRIGTIQAP